jgi:glycosyltransferase involved in cell wall biosynthesis
VTLIVHAPNVHQGGGRTLLLSVLNAVTVDESVALLDHRLDKASVQPTLAVECFSPTLLGRWRAERRVNRLAKPGDIVLCFGNLPPLFRNEGKVAVFLQNRYLFGQRDLRAFSLWERWRIRLERLWFARRMDATSMVIYVQTPSMADELLRETGIEARVFPFAPKEPDRPAPPAEPQFDFIYVASGEPHKNHRQLIDAWKLLGLQGLFPSLCLTLDPKTHAPLVQHLQRVANEHGLRITNLGTVAPTEMTRCYRQARALIYPSTLESFGLPLIEAAGLGLPVLASELDYVRDVVTPVASFDPHSPLSIARAVRRFLHENEGPQRVSSPMDFVHAVLERSPSRQSSKNERNLKSAQCLHERSDQ